MAVTERNAIRENIGAQALPVIFQAMLDAERVEHDSLKQMGLQTTFAGALKNKQPTPEFLQQLRMFLLDSSNSNFERQLVIGALEHAATRETVDLLLEVARTSGEKSIAQSAGSLAGVGSIGHGGPELLPALEKTWRDSTDPKLLWSTASTMAKIGAPSGVQRLLATVRAGNKGDKNRLVAAQQALQEVYLPSAVPPLAAALADQPASPEVARQVALLLVKIGDPSAARAVVGWLQNQPEDVSPLIHELIIERTTNSEMLAAWTDAVAPTKSFRNEKNRDAIRNGLAEYHRARIQTHSP
jgi:HEAT repeat protein